MATVLKTPSIIHAPFTPRTCSISSKSPKPFCVSFRHSTPRPSPLTSLRFSHLPSSLRFVKFVPFSSSGETDTTETQTQTQEEVQEPQQQQQQVQGKGLTSLWKTLLGHNHSSTYPLRCLRDLDGGIGNCRHCLRIIVGDTIYGFPWKSIWKQKIPSRVAFFVWTAALGKCLTIGNLRKRKVWILDWCYMCKRNGESVDHLFLHCPIAMDLWSMVYGFGFIWSNLGVMLHTVLGLLGCWQGSFGRHRNGYIWSIIPHCLMWCLWKERNSRCSEDIERSILDLELFFFRTLVD
uniref:Reverse transcriptase zinc-binding domain-containing protein n=1 Tax=Quercus lobata TaxID=97700 RepID=A0A7N2M3Y2_QUELO